MKKLIYSLVAVVTMSFSSCSDSFLDKKQEETLPVGVVSIQNLDSSSPLVIDVLNRMSKDNFRVNHNQLNPDNSELVSFNNDIKALLIPFNETTSDYKKTLTVFFKDNGTFQFFTQEIQDNGSVSGKFTGTLNFIDSENSTILELEFSGGQLVERFSKINARTMGCMDNCTSHILTTIAGHFPTNIACMVLGPSCAAAVLTHCIDLCYFD